MARLAALAVLAVVLAVVDAKSSVSVLATPDYMSFRPAGPLAAEHVATVIAGAMGLETPQKDIHWDGLLVGSSLQRPRASALITVLGHDAELPVIKSNSYDIDQSHVDSAHTLQAVLTGAARSGSQNVASLVSKSFEGGAETISICSDAAIARLAGAASRFGSFNSIVTSASNGGFEDLHGANFRVSAEELAQAVKNGVFGSDITEDDRAGFIFLHSVGAEGFHLDATSAPVAAFVRELAAMVLVAQRVAPRRALFASMVVSTWSAAAAHMATTEDGVLALDHLLEAAVEAVAARLAKAYPNSVVIYGCTLPAGQVTAAPAAAAAHHVARRDLAGVGATPDPTADKCDTYECFCNKDKSGTPFDPTTGCAKTTDCEKNIASPTCECAFHPCDCASPYVQNSSRAKVCLKCKKGYLIMNGVCYVDSNYPVMVNIWLWVGIALILALLATCYVLGEMDPGRNSVIYRMTSQKPKSS
eukprot:m.35144 g.35144  ORF g.35144 m.35144 type:complete len:474 (+) comp11251_c0_seq1:163-1584(+)